MIKTVKIADLKEADYNPRKIGEKALSRIKSSLKEFGNVGGIVINSYAGRENVVISGHQRIKAAKELGWEEIDVKVVSLDPAKEKVLNLALNKAGGEWDEERLVDMIARLEQENQDIMHLTAFSTEEINYLLDLDKKQKEAIFGKGDEDYTQPGDNGHGIKEGDVVVLEDKHKIICGDSTKPETFRKLLGEEKIDLVVTSPPYNLDIKYGKYSDNKDFKEYIEMIRGVFSNCKDFINKGRFTCVNIGREWGPVNIPAKYDNVMEGLGYQFFRNIYWNKPLGAARATITSRNPFPRHYIPKVQTEIIEIYSNEEEPEIYNSMITYKFGTDKPKRTEQIPQILLNKYAGNVWGMAPETTLSGNHPAPFPIGLPFNCIRFFTFENELILDCFNGSGTTIIAADQLNRKGYGIELDPAYVSFAIDRYLQYKPDAQFFIIRPTEKPDVVEVLTDGNKEG